MSFVKNQQKLSIDAAGKVAEAASADTADTATTATTATTTTTATTASQINSPILVVTQTGSITVGFALPYKWNSVVRNDGFTINAVTGFITIPSTGLYHLSGYGVFAASASDYIEIGIWNSTGPGILSPQAISFTSGNYGTEPASASFDFKLNLTSGQIIKVIMLSYNLGNCVLQGGSNQLVIEKIRD